MGKALAGKDERHCWTYVPGDGVEDPTEVTCQWFAKGQQGEKFTNQPGMQCARCITFVGCPASLSTFERAAFMEDGEINGKPLYTTTIPQGRGQPPAEVSVWYGAGMQTFILGPKNLAGKDEKHCWAYVPADGVENLSKVTCQWFAPSQKGEKFTNQPGMKCAAAEVVDRAEQASSPAPIADADSDCNRIEQNPPMRESITLTRGLARQLLDDIARGGGKHCSTEVLERWGLGQGPQAWGNLELALQAHLENDPSLAKLWVEVATSQAAQGDP